MGWSWDHGNNGWYGKQQHGAWWKGQASKPKAKSWGLWKCECGNTQTGSQCKSCGKKWWTVDWEKAEPNGQAARKAAKASAKPPTTPQSMQDMISFLDKFLSHKPQAGDGQQVMEDLQSLAAGLREGIAGAEPKVSKGNKLKSVIDKLAFKKAALHSLKAKLKQAQQELEELENNHDALASEVASLEEERTELANLVANQPDSESEDEQDGQATEKDHVMGAQHWAPKPKAKPKVEEPYIDLTRMPQADIVSLLRCVKNEAKKRKMNDTQSTDFYTQEDDDDDDDYEEEETNL